MKDLSDCRILIVDDVAANVDVLVRALRNDHKLAVALNGEAALRSVEKSPPDLILLDVVMPGMDGYEVCRRLRADARFREIPVMFLSALEDVQNKAIGFEVGGNDFLSKPFDMVEVKARVRSLLKAKAYTDAAKEKIAADLRIARSIQMGLLSGDLPGATLGLPIDLRAILEPATEVGGDFFDVIRPEPGRVVLVVGDVSGKGIPAALFMAVTLTLVRSLARQGLRPDDILRRLNAELEVQNPQGMFVTVACISIDLATRVATCANAAHNAPILLRPGEPPRLVFPATATVAGVFPDLEIGVSDLELAAGDRLVLYTDGVTEAADPDGHLYREDRLIAELGRDGAGTDADVIDEVLSAVRRHAGGASQSDDITILVAHLTG